MTHDEISELKPGDKIFMQLKMYNSKATTVSYIPVTVMKVAVAVTVKLPNNILKICPAHTLFKEHRENETLENRR